MGSSATLSPGDRPVAVFSQPNHELVILGLIRRLNCPIIFLSDGGAPQRIAQTEAALRIIRHRAPVLCLNYSEASIYQALWSRDVAFFDSVSRRLASRLSALRAGAILTVPVELHNPIHDLTPVLCRRAARISGLRPAFYDVPLIYQDARSFSYLINRFPSSIADRRICKYQVPLRMLTAKFVLSERVYVYLREYLERLHCAHSAGGFRMEHYRPASDGLEEPSASYRARYDARGKRLKKAGAVQEIITYHGHFAPMANELLPRSGEEGERMGR